MFNPQQFAPHARPPTCATCGGSGYVYLWSIPRVGARVWFCDRSTCKRFWSDAASGVGWAANAAAVVTQLQPVGPPTEQRELLPV